MQLKILFSFFRSCYVKIRAIPTEERRHAGKFRATAQQTITLRRHYIPLKHPPLITQEIASTCPFLPEVTFTLRNRKQQQAALAAQYYSCFLNLNISKLILTGMPYW